MQKGLMVFNREYKYMARDLDETIHLFMDKPVLDEVGWDTNGSYMSVTNKMIDMFELDSLACQVESKVWNESLITLLHKV